MDELSTLIRKYSYLAKQYFESSDLENYKNIETLF